MTSLETSHVASHSHQHESVLFHLLVQRPPKLSTCQNFMLPSFPNVISSSYHVVLFVQFSSALHAPVLITIFKVWICHSVRRLLLRLQRHHSGLARQKLPVRYHHARRLNYPKLLRCQVQICVYVAQHMLRSLDRRRALLSQSMHGSNVQCGSMPSILQ